MCSLFKMFKCLNKRMVRKKMGRKILLVCGLSLFFILMIHMHLTQVQRKKRDLILMTLGSRNTLELVKPHESTIIIDATQSKEQIDSKVPFAVIAVLSQIGYEENRSIVRQTWCQWAKSLNVQIIFFLGIPPGRNFSMSGIESEASEHKDIVVDEFVEDYYLLTVKVLRILKWFQNTYPAKTKNHHRQPNFLVKADHDVFIHLPNLIRHLKTVADVSNYLGGLLHHSAPAIRDGYSKWFTPYELWNASTFPPFLRGPCYYIHGSFVGTLLESSLNLPLFHLEDVFLTGFVAKVMLNASLEGLSGDRVIHSKGPLTQWRHPPNIHIAISYHPMDSESMLNYYQLTNQT